MLSSSSSTLELLAEFGPGAAAREAPEPGESLAYCRRLARARQENFPVLTRLLDPALVDPFAAVYAFCRWADDLGDEHTGSADDRALATERLAWWRGLTQAWHAGEPATHPVFVALSAIGRGLRVPLPLRPFLDLIDAFEQDQRVTRYQTWEQVLGYCARSANPVGRLVLCLGGVEETDRDPDAEMPHARRMMLEQSDALCTALQLTNFWQDARRDLLERDRVYLPAEVTGFDAQRLREWSGRANDPAARVVYIRAVRGLVDRTTALFQQSEALHELVPEVISTAVWLFHRAGRATLDKVDASGCTTLWRRPALSKVEKGILVARAWVRERMGRRDRRGRNSESVDAGAGNAAASARDGGGR